MNEIREQVGKRFDKMAGPGCFFEVQTLEGSDLLESICLIREEASRRGIEVSVEEISACKGRLIVAQI